MTEIETQDLVDNVNKQLSKLGWIINPFNTTGKQMDELTEILKQPLEEKIYLTLNESVVAFSYRSHYAVRALQLQSVKDYSHLYENGIFSYFRSDYISCTLNLLCALEGTLLRFYRHHATTPKDEPTVKELLNCFHDEPFQSRYENVNRWFEIYNEALYEALNQWIYVRTKNADLSKSVLNRNYIFHAVGSGNFYRREDVHRLILYFDNLLEILAMREERYDTFVSDIGSDPLRDKRANYYMSMMIEFAKMRLQEEELLKEHANYVSFLPEGFDKK